MDRESMGLWLGYTQKVAAALERAFEIEEREATQHINDTGNRLMAVSAPAERFPEKELEEYLDAVKQGLGADYVHLRLQDPDLPDKYRLIAGRANPLGKLHHEVRPFLFKTEGSIRHAIQDQEVWANTVKATKALDPDIALPLAPLPRSHRHEEKTLTTFPRSQ